MFILVLSKLLTKNKFENINENQHTTSMLTSNGEFRSSILKKNVPNLRKTSSQLKICTS